MAEADIELVLRTAQLARLDLTEERARLLAPQFARILEALEVIGTLDLEGLEPMLGATELEDVVRPDLVRPGLAADEALANAPLREGDFYRVPRVVGGEA